MFSLSSRLRFWLLLTLVVAGFGTLARGQTISGTIVGTVTDQQGGILAGVGVTATNGETALTYQGVTDTTRGLFVIPEVPPGLYRVRAQFSGFQTQEHNLVRVDVNRVTEEDFTLKIYVSPTVVVVQSSAPMTDTNTATRGDFFDQNQIRELPILSRDINNLALLAPGVVSVRTFSFASTLVPFASNGSGGRYNNFIIDSVSNNEPIFGGAATQFSNPDIFADYAITDGAPKAEFGRDSGSTVNVITKSGSSKLHGTAFWFGQYSQLNAMTRADTAAQLSSTPPAYENKLGGTLGGPLGKKDTFFFLSYQYDGAGTDLSNAFPVIGTVPTTSGLSTLRSMTQTPALATMLSYPSASLAGVGGQCFAATPTSLPGYSGAIPSTTNPCFFTGSSGTVGTTPGYTGAANPDTVQFGSIDIPQANLFNVYDHQASARIDRRLNDSNDFYGRYLIDDLNTPQALLNPAGDVAFDDLGRLPDSRSVMHQRTQSFLLDERFARSDSLNEMRFSYSRIAQGIGAYNLPSSLRSLPSATVADQFGGFGGYQNDLPSAGVQFTLGQDTSPSVTHSNVFEVQENYSLDRGRHFIKVGVDYVHTQSNIINVPSDLGHYFFGAPYQPSLGGFKSFLNEGTTSTQTNAYAVLQSFPDVITNSAGLITGQGQNEMPLRETDIALFVQDDFHIRPNFTLNVGLRYERFGQPINGILSMNPAAGSPLPTSSGDFGPRIGLAWAPGADRKTVIRAGYALMYNQMPLNIPLSMWQSAPISPTIATLTNAGANAFNTVVSSGFTASGLHLPVPTLNKDGIYPNSPLDTQAISSISVLGCSGLNSNTGLPLIWTMGTIPLNNCSTQNSVAHNLVSPYIQNWSIGVQRELNRNMILDVAYIGTKGTDLYAIQDLNPNTGWNLTSCAGVGANCLDPRLNPNRGDITAVTNAALSTYNALQANLNTRTLDLRGNSLTFTASYTYSHMIDTASDIFGPSVRILNDDSVFQSLDYNSSGLASVQLLTPFPEIYGNLRNERGNSSFDRRHRFVFSEIWGLPAPSNLTRAGKALLGGWNLNGIGTVQSGQPYTPLNGIPTGACADAAGDGQLATERPDIGNPSAPAGTFAIVADPTCRSATSYNMYASGSNTPTVVNAAQAYSQAHFVQVPLGRTSGGNTVYGTAGRNILTGPGIVDFDFALFKQFHWADNSKVLEFRWEVYDLFNRPNRSFLLGNVFSSNAQPTPGFAFARGASAAGVTGAYPENALDATTPGGSYDFGSTGNMNTGNRTMQVGIHFTF